MGRKYTVGGSKPPSFKEREKIKLTAEKGDTEKLSRGNGEYSFAEVLENRKYLDATLIKRSISTGSKKVNYALFDCKDEDIIKEYKSSYSLDVNLRESGLAIDGKFSEFSFVDAFEGSIVLYLQPYPTMQGGWGTIRQALGKSV